MSEADDILAQRANLLKPLEIEKRKKVKHLANLNQSVAQTKAEISVINDRMNAIKTSSATPIVTEHAILRYIQRIEGRSLDEIIRTIVPPEVATRMRILGSGTYTVDERFMVRVKDGMVVTVFKPGEAEE